MESNMEPKKLKDLRKGDRVYRYDFAITDEALIIQSIKRTGNVVEAVAKWENEKMSEAEYECVGHALSTFFTAYVRKTHFCMLISSDLKEVKFEELEYKSNIRRNRIGSALISLIDELELCKNG